jgi:hypothetical protein
MSCALVFLSKSIGGGIGFLLGRYFFREWIEEKLKSYPQLQRLSGLIKDDGMCLWFTLLFTLRLESSFSASIEPLTELVEYLWTLCDINCIPRFHDCHDDWRSSDDISKRMTVRGFIFMRQLR